MDRGVLSWEESIDCGTTAINDARVLLVQGDPETPYTGALRNTPITEVQTEQVAVVHGRQRGKIVVHSTIRRTSVNPSTHLKPAEAPVVHCPAGNASVPRDSAIVHTCGD